MIFGYYSASLSGGTWLTVYRALYICALDFEKFRFEQEFRGKLGESSDEVQDSILKFELQSILKKIINKSKVSIPIQISTEGLKIEDFSENFKFLRNDAECS